MTKWEYKCIPLDRRGTKEDFSFSWTYGPWELVVDQGAKKLLPAGLDELGRQGWELAAVLPSDLWSEGTRTANASHGVRTISCTLVFKRPKDEQTERSPASTPSAATVPTATAPAATAPSATPPPPGASATSAAPTSTASTPAASTPPDSAAVSGAPAPATPESSATAPSDSPA